VSFRARLVLASAYLLAVVVVVLEVPLALNLERRAASEFQSGVLGNAAILAARSSDLVAGATDASVRRLERLVRETTQTEEQERILVTDAAGRVLVDSDAAAARGARYANAERPEFGVALFQGRIDVRRRFSDSLGQELLLVTVPIVENQRVVGAVRVSAPTGAVQASVHRSWLRLALIGLAVFAAGLILAWFLATSFAKSLEGVRDAASALGRGDLGARAPAEGPKELRAVAATFNNMAGALASNLEAQRDFLANASHQLRTPLTGVKLRLEALKERGGETGAQAAKAEAELDRLSELVDGLLELARASSADPTGRGFDLAEAARAAVQRWSEPAERSGKRLRLVAAERAGVWGNSTDVAHIFDNLIENALRYTPPGTQVTVETSREDGRATLRVCDDGPGIAPADRDRVFERFYRGSNGRQAGPGTGLGLAIVVELARRWGGEVRLLEGPGTRIEASFPAAPTVS
jgi:two-component system, OmpR family, sensor kinase